MNPQTTIPGTAPKVEMGTIRALMESLTYRTTRVDGTTTTLAAATLPNGFVVAVGMSACVSPENFNAELGIDLAVSDAKRKAHDELWKLEGYALIKVLDQPKASGGADWQARMLPEAQELAIKLEKLMGRVRSDTNLLEVDRDLLNVQAAAMTSYLSVLHMRCKRAGLIPLNPTSC